MSHSNQTALHAPLPLPRDHWRSRWLVTGRWTALHRIAEIEFENGEWISGHGISVCGRKARWHMPGIFSRMDLKRCPKCCKALGIPEGDGAPFNVLKGKAANA